MRYQIYSVYRCTIIILVFVLVPGFMGSQSGAQSLGQKTDKAQVEENVKAKVQEKVQEKGQKKGQETVQDSDEGPQIEQIGPHNSLVVRAVGQPGHYVGFDLLADGNLVAPVRFTSHALIYSAKAIATHNGFTSTLLFDDLEAVPESGASLTHSRILVTLQSEQYPTVAFDLQFSAFDGHRWREALGAQPFHFLTLAMPDATVWHQQGRLHATPRADLFPLLLNLQNGLPISSLPDNREWSRFPLLAEQPLPVIGLWAPDRRLYAAWDFEPARLGASGRTNTKETNTKFERIIATGYCNRLIVSTAPTAPESMETIAATEPIPDADTDIPHSRHGEPLRRRDPRTRPQPGFTQQAAREYDRRGLGKFVALVYPPQGGQDDAKHPVLLPDSEPLPDFASDLPYDYPIRGTRLAAQATLMFHTDLGPMDDPNRLLWQHWWDTPALYERLPCVPRTVALDADADNSSLPHLATEPTGSLIADARAPYQIPGTHALDAAGWHNESAVEVAFHQNDRPRLAQLEADAQTLLRYARRFTVETEKTKETCIYWENPLIGEWAPAWGGEAATTLHHANGWAAARLLLDIYRVKTGKIKTGARELPACFTAIPTNTLLPLVDGALAWARHIVWMRGEIAASPATFSASEGALATAFLLDYYFTFQDSLQDGERRSRALQALELARSLTYRNMAMWAGGDNNAFLFLWQEDSDRANGTGADPSEAVVSALEGLAQVAVHTGDPLLLWALQGSLSRWPQKGAAASALNRKGVTRMGLLSPSGATQARILCGEKAALAFQSRSSLTPQNFGVEITRYHCTRAGDFSVTLRRTASGVTTEKATEKATERAPILVTLTFPGIDISAKRIRVRRGSLLRRDLETGREVITVPNALWSCLILGLQDGDTLLVGDPDENGATPLPTLPPRLERAGQNHQKNQ